MPASCIIGSYRVAGFSYVLRHVEQARMMFYRFVRRLVIRNETGKNQKTSCMLYTSTDLVKCSQ